jgi:hypothetical protein
VRFVTQRTAASRVIHAGQASELSGCRTTTSSTPRYFEPPGNQHGLPAPRMEPIVDPSLDQVSAGSMSPFRVVAEQRTVAADIKLRCEGEAGARPLIARASKT